ncbi:MAG: NAD-dependent epimerase/dehydratase family protein, partial [Rhodobacteraceae bacterium]|nr:NAD-dependent epimerase/dehydratase family protein [Paracoccaceae bacterium]
MGALTLAVTGAGGFIGRHVVAAAAAAGHPVVAVIRPGAQAQAGWPGAVAVRRADLTGPAAALAQAVAGADAVIHCAGLMTGDAAAQAAVSVEGTRALCAVLPAGAGLVVVSSIAVCGAGADADGSLTGTTPRADPATLAPYAATRAAQEEVAEAWAAAAPGRRLTLLRAGAVFGPGRLWNGHLGVPLGPVV